MPYLNDRIYDNGLTVLDTEANVLHICTQEPTDYAGATTTYSKGSKTGLSIGAPGAGSPNGRKVTDAAPSSILSGPAQISGTKVFQTLTGGVDGAKYGLLCQASDGTKTFELADAIEVKEPMP